LFLALYALRRIAKESLSVPSAFLGKLVKIALYTSISPSFFYYSYKPCS
jgi:hypothetical protein